MRALGIAAITAGVAFGILGCGGSNASDNVDKYKQTWKTPYGQTTCPDFQQKMTEQQRWAMAADILSAALSKDRGKSTLPPDSLITSFEKGLNNVCGTAPPTQTMAELGAVLYLTEQQQYSY